MFTGLVQGQGRVEALELSPGGARLSISTGPIADLTRGESIAVNGVCLTAFPDGEVFHADLSNETLARTALGQLAPGTRVNLERALRLSDRLGGHLVQGHVDATGTLLARELQGEFANYRWSYPAGFAALLVDKGSICVDGVSLTIVEPDSVSFGAALIPETLSRTSLGEAAVGQLVNLEFDVIAKLVARLAAPYFPAARN